MYDNQIIHGPKAVKINKFSTLGVENLFKTVETYRTENPATGGISI